MYERLCVALRRVSSRLLRSSELRRKLTKGSSVTRRFECKTPKKTWSKSPAPVSLSHPVLPATQKIRGASPNSRILSIKPAACWWRNPRFCRRSLFSWKNSAYLNDKEKSRKFKKISEGLFVRMYVFLWIIAQISCPAMYNPNLKRFSHPKTLNFVINPQTWSHFLRLTQKDKR